MKTANGKLPLGAGALSILLLASVLSASAAPLPASRMALVAYASGDVRIDGKRADLGQVLGAAVLVETGPGARCDIVFGGGNALTVAQNARVAFDFASPAIAVKLDKGGVTSVLKKLDKLASQASYKINTQQTVAAVRGTSFCVWADAVSTYVCACNGEVHTEDLSGGNALDLASAHHVARTYSRVDGKTTVAEAGLLHHDDASVESTAKAIGYTVDWSTIDR